MSHPHKGGGGCWTPPTHPLTEKQKRAQFCFPTHPPEFRKYPSHARRSFSGSVLKNVNTYPPVTHIFLKRPFHTAFKKYTHTPPPPQRNNILAHWANSAEKPVKMPKPSELAHSE